MIGWSLVRLRMLSELHRLGTLAEVARSMSYSPSAVSQQLAQLERESGTTLLERVGRRVRLTDAALILVEHADAVLERLERAESHLAHARPETAGTLHVASFQTPLLSIAPPALSLLAERHPALRITITQQELAPSCEGLLTREFDLILGEEFPGVHEELRPGGGPRPPGLGSPPAGAPAGGALVATGPAHGPRRRPVGAGPRGHPGGRLGALGAAHRRVRAGGALRQPRPPAPGSPGALGPCGGADPLAHRRPHLGGTRLRRLPGDPRRQIYTAVRAGRSAHPAIRAFRTALQEAALAESPRVADREIAP